MPVLFFQVEDSLRKGKYIVEKKSFFEKIKDLKKRLRKSKLACLLWDVFSMLFLFAIAGGIGVFVAISKHVDTPEKIAKEYVEAYLYQDWAMIYESIVIEESEFVNYEAFERMMEGKAEYGEYKEIKAELVKEGKKYAYVDVTYTNEETHESKTIHVTLAKQEKKQYWFFDTWKVDGNDNIIKEYTIDVPSEVDVTFDSKDITGYLKKEENGRKVYVIDRMLSGDHDVAVSNVYIDAYSEAVSIEENGLSYVVNISDFDMKMDDVEYVEAATEKIVFGMYSNALNNTGTEDLKGYFGESSESQALLEECYNAMYNSVNQADGETLKTLNVESYDVYHFSYKYPDAAEVRLDFNCSFEAKTGRTMINGVRGSYSGTASSSAKVCFTLVNGVWVVDSLEVNCFDYLP